MTSPSTAVPLALLPVRLETRFVAHELRVLIVPDTLHVDTFEPEFTDAEVLDGASHWEQVWRSGGDEQVDEAAWRTLAARYGPERAAWIARTMRPDLTLRPTSAIPADEVLNPPPVFPEPPRRESSWARPPRAVALPTRWKAEAQVWSEPDPSSDSDGTKPSRRITAVGAEIPRDLALGPDPAHKCAVSTDECPDPAHGFKVPKWLTDFPAAEEVGMGLRMNIGAHTKTVHRLVVWGVDEKKTPGEGASQLNKILEAHYYTDGFSYLSRGTPTNNTSTTRSGYTHDGSTYLASYRVRDTDPVTPPTNSDADLLTHALGVSSSGVAGHLAAATTLAPGAFDTSEPTSRAMQELLWGATGAYWLSQMLAPVTGEKARRLRGEGQLDQDLIRKFAYAAWENRLAHGGEYWGRAVDDWLAGENAARYGPATVAKAREHVVSYLRPGGPLPPLRVGTQPYGVLPVLVSNRWTPEAGEERHAPVLAALRALRDTVWLPAAWTLPRLGTDRQLSVADAQAALVNILATAPVSTALYARQHLGRDYLANLWRFARIPLDPEWEQTVNEASARVRSTMGIAWQPRLAGLVAGDYAAPVALPLITGEQPASTYLSRLASTTLSWTALRETTTTAGDLAKTPLLYILARHSALREYADAAIALRQDLGSLGDWEHLETEMVDARVDALTATPWRQLAEMYDTGAGVAEIGATVGGLAGPPASPGITAFRSAANILAPVDPAQLDLVLRETLDGWSHRLDAWFTSYASRRLTAVRRRQPTGLAIGGYGVVEKLTRRCEPHSDECKPHSDGFVHAPSLDQAVTAGLLRSGYTSHSGGGRNPFAINLSSTRVRTAKWLLDGVRNGQPLATLGGYLFERAIHDAEADELLDTFRAMAPTEQTDVPTGEEPPARVSGVTVPSPVVDGLALRQLWAVSDARILAVLEGLGPVGSDKRKGVETALNALENALDATADVLLAESVHHAAAGNPSRAAATLDALARGDGGVPDPTFISTPRTAVTVTNRVALVAPATSDASGWQETDRPRVVAAGPAVERIAAALLPDPGIVRCSVRLVTPDHEATAVVRMSECDLAAIDCVLESSNAINPEQPIPAAVELAVRDVAAHKLNAHPGDQLIIDWAPQPDWAPTDYSFGDLTAAARLAWAALRPGRPLVGGDLVEPERSAELAVPADPDLPVRADRVLAVLRAAVADMAQASTEVAGISAAAALGVPGAAAALLPGATKEAKVAIMREMELRLTKALAVDDDSADPANNNPASALDPNVVFIYRIAAVVGDELPVSRAVYVENRAAFATAVAEGTARVGASLATVRHWLQRLSRVRPALRALSRVAAAASSLRGFRLSPQVLQLPSVDGEPWIGHAVAGQDARLNVVLYPTWSRTDGVPEAFAGLIVDEWVEQVPLATQKTGVAFSVDTPAAQAPQAILLGVTPDASQSWNDDLVLDTILEALTLAKVRAVDLEAVDAVGQLLPGLYLAHNTNDATVSSEVLP